MMTNLDFYQLSDEHSIDNQLRQAMGEIFGENVMAVVCKSYFVLLKFPQEEAKDIVAIDQQGEFVLHEGEYSLTSDPFLNNQGMALGKQKELFPQINRNVSSEKIIAFKERLLRVEIEWIRNYASALKEFLSCRIAEGVPIIKYEAVRMNWADLAERQKCLNQIVDRAESGVSKVIKEDILVLVPRLIREACELLAKLAGGRAFLKGQAVEMLWLFNILNKIYFSGEFCHE